MRRYLLALPRRAQHNLRVQASAGPKGLLTTLIPWCAPIVGLLLGWSLGAFVGIPASFLGATFGLVLGIVVGYRIIRQVETAFVFDLLRGLCSAGRLPQCPLCGQDQRGTTSTECSECGCNVEIDRVI